MGPEGEKKKKKKKVIEEVTIMGPRADKKRHLDLICVQKLDQSRFESP